MNWRTILVQVQSMRNSTPNWQGQSFWSSRLIAYQQSIARTWLDVTPSGAFVVSRAKINAPLHTPRVCTNTCLCVACASCYCSWTIKSSNMNTIIMNQDVHTPAFIKADASNKTNNIKQQPTSPKQVRRFSWTRFIELAILLSVVIGAIWLISKMVTSASRNCRLCHCRFSDTTLYSPDSSENNILRCWAFSFGWQFSVPFCYACFEKHSSFMLFH